ncbi:Acyl-CoA synthetase (AMP-forming)/AMP-acid ligase II [Geosmithia morbida]|uniref:Acyl-CoA synthetase (AMP-forming)/AMP-acid ligase II n=1 Tax=Geosmithia morbida TaxID=1094350 RepID=A0A9P4YPE2_9HYPO|nr:Acyl-CoA synthetase (AMP-forming)/AMP-acid ligase II [Geosmithia morbida]KAF4119364.1 Acyl-CoA synthetase (AMP-forming)/AMP-acid ligase II [Geosmithia morbida]
MLSEQDLSVIRSFEQGTATTCPYPTVTSSFYHHALSYPDAIAARDMSCSPPRELTYLELASRAQSLAAQLRGLGVGRGQRVPILVKRGLEMVVGIWAVLSCGAQYVPLDGGVVPETTIRTVIEQSGGSVVLCISSTEHRLHEIRQDVAVAPVLIDPHCRSVRGAALPDTLLDLATPDSGCYVIYTSGTTGKPKGVDVTHRNVANLVCQSPGDLGVRPGTCVGSILNISFDMAAWEIFTCMCNGGTLVIRGSKWEPTLEQINVLICTPTILSKYSPTQFPRIKTVATAGEASSQNLADLWAMHTTYWNCCGPTETTIVNTMSRHVVGQKLSIGKPTPNNTVYILDDDLNRVPLGSAGSMWAGGHGVSRGYVGLESKTKECYLADKFADDGSCMYKTGDLGQWGEDGAIEILGRADDQVKVKGFRVELDGIAATLAAYPGATRATALLIDGEIHGFVSPDTHSAEAILEHARKSQPYYAVPSRIHLHSHLPSTANGKIDKKALQVMAKAAEFIESEKEQFPEKSVDLEANIETRSLSSTTTLNTAEAAKQLTDDIPEKRHGQPWRGLRHRILIVYRRLFSIVWLINVGFLVAQMIGGDEDDQWLEILTAANLLTAILMRQELVINALYTAACSVPRSFPLWIRSRCADIYHLGGVHSATGICATAWLLISTVRSTVAQITDGSIAHLNPNGLAVLVLSWLLCLVCTALVVFAWPNFRKNHHDLFERYHRFGGWTALAIFWVRAVLTIDGERSRAQQLALALVRSPTFWMLVVATVSISFSWMLLRKVPVETEVLSDHAVRLHFDYTTPVHGSFTRLSQRPLIEWHSFAAIPKPKPAGKGYSLIVSNAGDWTRNCIQNPPTHMWVRGLPTCGVMRIATLFNRVVLIATGSGIGPVLGHVAQPSCPTQLLWSTKDPERTFGKEIMDTIHVNIPDAVIHDTKVSGRPDLVRMGYNMAQNFGAEAVIIIANEKITKKVVYGLQTRGMPAYGAIWDS